MMRFQEVGRRYLAGFVIAAAVLYLAATCATSAIAWQDTYHSWLLTNLLALGVVPSFAAAALGIRAWSAKPVGSAAFSAVALVILIFAVAFWQLFVVSFR